MVLLFLAGFALVGCRLSDAPKSIEISGPAVIDVNLPTAYSVTSDPVKADLPIVWSSSNTEVATVDAEGNLTGLCPGIIRLTAKLESDPDIKDYIDVEIKAVVITEVNISGETALFLGSETNLTAAVIPAHAIQDVTWSSDDETVATVDQNGIVSGLAVGIANITAASTENPAVFETLAIEVTAAPIESIAIFGQDQVFIDSVILLSAKSGAIDVSGLVDWSVSDSLIADIDELGNVVGISEGEVIVTATLKSNSAVYAVKTVTVIYQAFQYFDSKVLSIDTINKKIELLGCPATTYDAATKFIKTTGDVFFPVTVNDLYLGMENVYVQVDSESKTIASILIDGEKGFANIRVGIRRSIGDISVDETLYHDTVTFTLLEDMRMQTFDGLANFQLLAGTQMEMTVSGSNMVVKRNGTVILETSKRLIFVSETNYDNVTFTSISRGMGNPSYAGNMEVALRGDRLLVVNDLNLEKYLYKVIPSEMPASYDAEALKAQAIAARTYAYMDILRKSTESLGYTVDDSTKSQVYNNQNAQTASNAAVDQTQGLIMTNGGNPISAYYYSTSCGLTASGHEVWITGAVEAPIPYLIGQNLTQDEYGSPISFDPSSESNMLSFFKTLTMTTPDSSVKYHRWRVAFTKTQMANTLNVNLKLTYASTPNLVLTKSGDNWLSQAIPASIGDVIDVRVGLRGTSGVVMELIIETTTGLYKIINQYNIRFTVRPANGGSIVRTDYAKGTDTDYSSHADNGSILHSGFFAIETSGDTFTFYGGGNGHGVGMSQNGANGLAKLGKDHVEILTTYYSSIVLTDVTYNYVPLPDFEQYFQ